MKSRRIFVGIVVHNTDSATLEKTLASLKSSDTELDIGILCNSENEVYRRDIEQKFSAVVDVYITAKNNGFGAGHNELFRSSAHTWYICCNPDIQVLKNSISILISFAESKTKVGLIMPKVLNPDGTLQPIVRRHLTPYGWTIRQLTRVGFKNFSHQDLPPIAKDPTEIEFVSGCFFAIKSDIFRSIGGFDEHFFLYAEDADLSYRTQRIAPNYFVPQSVVNHEWAAAWKKSAKLTATILVSLVKFWFKHPSLIFKR